MSPNPVKDQLFIQHDASAITRLELVDIAGRRHLEAYNPTTVLSVENLTKGIYMLHVYSADQVHTQKIIKQ